jgi:branched-chain amino acid transport system permease protein
MRDSEIAAQAMGVDLALSKTGIFAFSAAYAGVAGALATHLAGYISPSAFSLLVSFQLLASIVVGGLGSIPGAILGAAVVTWLPFAASRTQGLASVIEGAAIIGIVLLLPAGLASLASRTLVSRLVSPQRRPAHLSNVQPAPLPASLVPAFAGPLLEVRDLSLSFGGVHALREVSFGVERGAIHGLIGPNGAGKTTALNCISRFIDPDRGAVRFAGQDMLPIGPSAVPKLGISRTFQNLELCRRLTALDNVMLGFYHRLAAPAAAFALRLPVAARLEAECRQQALQLLDQLGCDQVADKRVDSLPYGLQKRVELARALACGGQLLVLDEPAAGLDGAERSALVDLIRSVRAGGTTVLLVDHDMRLVMSVCNHITVLDFGRVIADGTPEQIQSNPTVIAAYLGEAEGSKLVSA